MKLLCSILTTISYIYDRSFVMFLIKNLKYDIDAIGIVNNSELSISKFFRLIKQAVPYGRRYVPISVLVVSL